MRYINLRLLTYLLIRGMQIAHLTESISQLWHLDFWPLGPEINALPVSHQGASCISNLMTLSSILLMLSCVNTMMQVVDAATLNGGGSGDCVGRCWFPQICLRVSHKKYNQHRHCWELALFIIQVKIANRDIRYTGQQITAHQVFQMIDDC